MLKKIRRLIILLFLLFCVYHLYVIHRNVHNVLKYQEMVETTLAENDTDANVELVLAMIYTETKGGEDDVMQSSESSSGMANSIKDSKTSIQQGVTLLSENIELAKEAKVDSWTAVQAYNFGTAYIDYIAEHGGKNTIELAKAYSRDVVAPSLGNTSGETYFYHHPLALISGGRLYKNGGNIYYSREVRFNLYLIRIMSLF
ncbi:lysozyme family protein [Streptococcus chenjunshii]|uniref:Lysozyme family protein n=1 Tax=Streptococcus chenjunshii TaxID=2173853 RepID=A0A372KP64_9STRE|nr:lysozyme family protein [Streptococcus chenjunshii]AXQ78665.1 lysozyme family protein [Streptococcus chenjunshii]RFU51871.1 lysozyme family protein [Streptococcus chenjunshii]RFU54063.1 lysozyme family protein [Streptococcus chenjunshii]